MIILKDAHDFLNFILFDFSLFLSFAFINNHAKYRLPNLVIIIVFHDLFSYDD